MNAKRAAAEKFAAETIRAGLSARAWGALYKGETDRAGFLECRRLGLCLADGTVTPLGHRVCDAKPGTSVRARMARK